MPSIEMIFDGDGCWPDLSPAWPDGPEILAHLAADSPPIKIAMLTEGMTSGKPSLMMRIEPEPGKVLLVETSLALFLTAAKGFAARAGVEF